jgi:hypothetical protein
VAVDGRGGAGPARAGGGRVREPAARQRAGPSPAGPKNPVGRPGQARQTDQAGWRWAGHVRPVTPPHPLCRVTPASPAVPKNRYTAVNDTRARCTTRAASVASVGRRLARRRGRQVQCGRTRSRCQRSSVAGETTRTLRDQPLRTPGSSGRNRVVSTASVSLPLRLAAHHEQVKQQGHQWGAG